MELTPYMNTMRTSVTLVLTMIACSLPAQELQPSRKLAGHQRDGDPDMVHSLVFSHGGKTLASVSIAELKLWDVDTGKNTAAFDGHCLARLVFARDDQTLVTGGGSVNGGEVFIRDVTTGKKIAELKGHRHDVDALVFNPDGKLLATAGTDGAIRIWDVKTRRTVATLSGHRHGVTSLAFSPDGKRLASGGADASIRLWDTTHWKQAGIYRLQISRGPDVTLVAFSPDGKTLLSGDDDGRVIAWDIATGNARPMTGNHFASIRCLALSPDGRVIATASSDGVLKLWNLASGKNTDSTSVTHDSIATCVAFSPDSKVLAVGYLYGAIALMRVKGG
jgi:WD40 repeat protein